MNEKEVKYIHIQLLDGDSKGRIHAKYADSSDRLEVYSVPRQNTVKTWTQAASTF